MLDLNNTENEIKGIRKMNKVFSKDVSNVTVNTDCVVPDDNIVLKGKKIEYTSACLLDVVIATNGPSDGDWGHGGRTYISLNKESCFDVCIKISPYGYKDIVLGLGDFKKIEFLAGGQCETHILRDFFKEAYRSLDMAIKAEEEKEEKEMDERKGIIK